jgi:hypothetical protein
MTVSDIFGIVGTADGLHRGPDGERGLWLNAAAISPHAADAGACRKAVAVASTTGTRTTTISTEYWYYW